MFDKLLDKYDRQITRILEMSLGFMTWGLLTSPIWMGLLYPQVVVYVLTFLTVYWSFLALKHTLGLARGFALYQKELKSDWMAECKKLNFAKLPDKATLPTSLDDIHHIFLIPAVNEPVECLRDCIDAILNQTFPSKQIVIVFTVEEKFAEQTTQNIKEAIGDRVKDLYKLMIYVHPAGIPGEAIGDGGANRAWGISHAVEDLRKEGENLRNFIFCSLDSDHVIHKQYVARLTHLYLSTDKRDNHYYSSAVPMFSNNLWRVPLMMRIEANAVTLGVLSTWGLSTHTTKKTFSAFCASLQTLIDANYFDVRLGADDTIFYWRAFFARNGEFDGIPFFLPYSADAVEGKNYFDSHRSLYKQLLRWGWGAIDFPLSIKGFMRNKQISLFKKLSWVLKHIEERVFLVNVVFLITFGFGIVTLVNPQVKQSNFAYSLPDMMSTILTFTLVFLIPATYYRLRIILPTPPKYPLYKKLIVFFESPLILINLLTYSFIPWIDAQTRIFFGKPMKDLYHTPKLR